MVKINLLPAGILRQRRRQRAQRLFSLVSVCVILLVAAGAAFLYLQAEDTQTRLIAVQAERAAVEAQIVTYSVYGQMEERVNRRAELLRAAMGAPPAWVGVLRQIGELIPPNVWLTSVMLVAGEGAVPPPEPPPVDEAVQPPGDAAVPPPEAAPVPPEPLWPPGQLMLSGLTYDHPSTARWISALRGVEGITEVQAVFSALEGAEEQQPELVRFELRAALPAGAQYDPLAQGGEAQ